MAGVTLISISPLPPLQVVLGVVCPVMLMVMGSLGMLKEAVSVHPAELVMVTV